MPKPVSMSKGVRQALLATTQGLKVSPALTRYLAANKDNGSLVDPKTAMTLIKLAKKRTGSRSGWWHPSALHSCQRSQMFGYLGVPAKSSQFTPEQINLFNDGTWRHIRHQVTMLMAGIVTHVEVPVQSDEYRLTGSMDGENRPESWMLEIKGTAQFDQVLTYGVMPDHRRQIHGYFVARPDLQFCSTFYEDKTTNRWHEVIVHPDKQLLSQTKGILNDLNESLDHQTLPPVLEECQYGEGAYKRCGYAYLCKQVGFPEAQAASKCGDQEEVIVTLGIKRRNTHQSSEHSKRKATASRKNELGTAVNIATQGGTLRVRRGADG